MLSIPGLLQCSDALMLDRHLDLARISPRQPSTQGLIVGANACPMICLGPHLWRASGWRGVPPSMPEYEGAGPGEGSVMYWTRQRAFSSGPCDQSNLQRADARDRSRMGSRGSRPEASVSGVSLHGRSLANEPEARSTGSSCFGNFKPKQRALTHGTRHPDLTTVRFDNRPGNRQPQARTSSVPAAGSI